MKNCLYIILVILVIIFIIYIYIDTINYRVTKYELESEIIHEDIHFVFISDLHECSYSENNQSVLDDIKKLNPDFIIFAGDIFTATTSKYHSFDKTIAFVNNLANICPVYYGLGNHEEKMKAKPDKFGDRYKYIYSHLNNENIHVLDNDSVKINNDVVLTGLSIDIAYYRKVVMQPMSDEYIESQIGKRDESKYNILIAHNPEYFDNYSNYGANLVLSGHNHGGIACLPVLGGIIAPSYKIFPKYDFGLFNKNKTTMILSRGMGGHTIPLRFNNRAEIIDISIKRKK